MLPPFLKTIGKLDKEKYAGSYKFGNEVVLRFNTYFYKSNNLSYEFTKSKSKFNNRKRHLYDFDIIRTIESMRHLIQKEAGVIISLQCFEIDIEDLERFTFYLIDVFGVYNIKGIRIHCWLSYNKQFDNKCKNNFGCLQNYYSMLHNTSCEMCSHFYLFQRAHIMKYHDAVCKYMCFQTNESNKENFTRYIEIRPKFFAKEYIKYRITIILCLLKKAKNFIPKPLIKRIISLSLIY